MILCECISNKEPPRREDYALSCLSGCCNVFYVPEAVALEEGYLKTYLPGVLYDN